MNLHRLLYLYQTPKRFYIQPVDLKNEALVIGRQDYGIEIDSKFSIDLSPDISSRLLIYGILGIKDIPDEKTGEICNRVLIVITDAIELGAINNETIYQMKRAKIIYFDPESNSTFIEGPGLALETVLETSSFYFSYSYDLTNNVQRIQSKAHPSHYNRRFLWNQHLMDSSGLSSVANRYYLPLIHGFIGINQLDRGITYSLISRRAVSRAGTRFNCRGADMDGNAANFVETEQIVEGSDIITSFIQVRGSIPLSWSQVADYRYKPEIRFDIDRDQTAIMMKHFGDLRPEYGQISVINLIDDVGHEAILEQEFSRRMLEQTSVPYHNFNFHHECGKMRWYRLGILIDELKQEISGYGYFAKQKNEVVQLQNGVFRTNCIDSLDRTNVVQSLIAQQVLEQIFARFNINVSLIDNSNIDMFKNTWADNADLLSIQYAGTSALKTDFTRTGRRTYTGAVRDGLNSLNRYVVNNFYDDYRQDAIDFFLGRHKSNQICKNKPLQAILRPYLQALPTSLVVITLLFLYFYFRY